MASALTGGAGFVDLWAAVHPEASGPTFPASAPSGRIDYVYLRPAGSGFAPATIERICRQARDGFLCSDHLGLSARVGRPPLEGP